MEICIINGNPKSKDAYLLMEELSEVLHKITGDNGKSSFNIEDLNKPKSIFLIARDKNNNAVGCGSIRQINDAEGEIKRMYSKVPGVGKQILNQLEISAIQLNYKTLKLETRKINKKAVDFYTKNGYLVIENYGKYIGNLKAICFQKNIS